MLCTIRFVRLLIRILFDIMYYVERQIFTNLSIYSRLLEKCHWTEMKCGRGELGSYGQPL